MVNDFLKDANEKLNNLYVKYDVCNTALECNNTPKDLALYNEFVEVRDDLSSISDEAEVLAKGNSKKEKDFRFQVNYFKNDVNYLIRTDERLLLLKEIIDFKELELSASKKLVSLLNDFEKSLDAFSHTDSVQLNLEELVDIRKNILFLAMTLFDAGASNVDQGDATKLTDTLRHRLMETKKEEYCFCNKSIQTVWDEIASIYGDLASLTEVLSKSGVDAVTLELLEKKTASFKELEKDVEDARLDVECSYTNYYDEFFDHSVWLLDIWKDLVSITKVMID